MKKLRGQVALITGASRGVGKSVALRLAREGCDIVIASKTDAPNAKLPGTIHDTAREVEALGVRALALKVDVRNEEEVERMAQQALATFGRIDILVNNAGAISLSEVKDTPAKKFDLMMGVNARAALLCTRAVLPSMIERRHGWVVNMSPPVSLRKLAGKTPYLISKFGMTMVALGVAEEEREHGIGACALWPVTMIESQATIHFGFGEPSDWRKPEMLADAVLAIVTSPIERFSGRALYDEEVLAAEGVTDFRDYAVVPGTEPSPASRELVE